MILSILAGLLLGVGAYCVAANLLKIPHMASSVAVTNLSKRQSAKTGTLDVWVNDLAAWLSKRIRLNEYRRIQLLSDLQSADINTSPELYTAMAVVKTAIVLLFAVPLYFIFPLLIPVVLVFAVYMYLQSAQSVREKIREKRKSIEYELPRMVFTIEKSLKHTRDVLYMLESVKQTAGPELRRELEITIADMRSSNYEAALTRLETRVGSTMLSDVTRGLTGIIHGSDTVVYWQSLAVKFSDDQRQLLKQQANKVPGKVKKLTMALLFCFMATYFVVLGVQIVQSLGGMFG